MISIREDKIAYKIKLKEFCENVVEHRITTSREAMASAQAAANAEGKSSAGDKYETARAMNHLEKDMHARQLLAHTEQLSALIAVNVDILCTTVAAGSFIQCENVNIFILAGLGKHRVDERDIVFISPNSPLAQKLNGKKVGDEFEFNGISRILDIF